MRDEGRRRRWSRIFTPDPRVEIDEELEFHVEQRIRDNIARGMEPEAARAAAVTRLGNLDGVRNECTDLLRAERRGIARRAFLKVSWLDFRLGFRMLVKYPGLTLVGGLGIAVAIAIGAGYTAVMKTFLDPVVPLPHGERLVGLENWDTRTRRTQERSLHDFTSWREELETVQDVGAYRSTFRNLVAADGSVEPVPIAEMSAAGFSAAGVQPLMGRYLTEDDEETGAPDVAVIGYHVWQKRFAADPKILGRAARVGTTIHTVVGVMPEGFAFPINHQVWTPFRANPNDYKRGEGPAITVFGRLASGATLGEARAEMKVVGQRAAAAYPETHERLQARVQPYTYEFSNMDAPDTVLALRAVQLLITLLLVVISVNVAALVYARTAVRRGELVVRTALGASRGRVVAQLFAEALVLALVSAAAGLGLAGVVLHLINATLAASVGMGIVPFWFSFRLSVGVVAYAVALAIIAAVITGVLPALKATGKRLQSSLQQLSSSGAPMLLGRTWTFLIIGQVAFAVALLPTAFYLTTEVVRYGMTDVGFPAEEYLVSSVTMERNADASDEASQAAFDARYVDRVTELMNRLRREGGVGAVTFAANVPGGEAEGQGWVEVEGVPLSQDNLIRAGPMGNEVRHARVDPGFFGVFEVPLMAGRGFTAADTDSTTTAVIVNQSFVRRFLADGRVLGRHIRLNWDTTHVARRWCQIVGVVSDFPPGRMESDEMRATLYQAATPAQAYPVLLAMRARGVEAASLAHRLRQVSVVIDPALQLRQVGALDEVYRRDGMAVRLSGLGVALVTLSVLLLSAAGIYAMMSLAVDRRRREIGIRAALGANPRRILANVFARAAIQLGIGIGVGLGAALLLDQFIGGATIGRAPVLVPVVSAIMLAVGLLASIVPARRGLRIQPTEALKHS